MQLVFVISNYKSLWFNILLIQEYIMSKETKNNRRCSQACRSRVLNVITYFTLCKGMKVFSTVLT